MKRNQQISLVLGLLSKAVEALSDDELEKIAHGAHSIEIKITRNRKNAKAATDAEIVNSAEITKNLESFSDRIFASSYLREVAANKKSLELIAKNLDIALSKQDKVEDLIKKIIESTVGARLRSSAIRGPEV